MARTAAPKLQWERYPKRSKTPQSAARFLLGKKIVLSGYAPDDEFNDKLCVAFNKERLK